MSIWLIIKVDVGGDALQVFIFNFTVVSSACII